MSCSINAYINLLWVVISMTYSGLSSILCRATVYSSTLFWLLSCQAASPPVEPHTSQRQERACNIICNRISISIKCTYLGQAKGVLVMREVHLGQCEHNNRPVLRTNSVVELWSGSFVVWKLRTCGRPNYRVYGVKEKQTWLKKATRAKRLPAALFRSRSAHLEWHKKMILRKMSNAGSTTQSCYVDTLFSSWPQAVEALPRLLLTNDSVDRCHMTFGATRYHSRMALTVSLPWDSGSLHSVSIAGAPLVS